MIESIVAALMMFFGLCSFGYGITRPDVDALFVCIGSLLISMAWLFGKDSA